MKNDTYLVMGTYEGDMDWFDLFGPCPKCGEYSGDCWGHFRRLDFVLRVKAVNELELQAPLWHEITNSLRRQGWRLERRGPLFIDTIFNESQRERELEKLKAWKLGLPIKGEPT